MNYTCFKNDSLEPTTGMDMPWSWESCAALDAGDSSTKSFLGGLTLQWKLNTGIRMTHVYSGNAVIITLHESHLSSVSEAGFEGLQGGELKGVPVSVSLELSRWLLSREIRFELPPFELRFKSAMLCSKENIERKNINAENFHADEQRSKAHPLLLLHKFWGKVEIELLLLYMCCFNLHPILQHVDVVCLSVHCK